MIHRSNRFHGLGSLGFLLHRGKTVRLPALSLRFVPNNRRETYRASVAVSRKVSKSAVVRNRIRRRIYEVMRTQGQGIKKPFDLLFVVHTDELSDMPIDTLTAQIATLLQKAVVLQGSPRSVNGPNHDIVKQKEK